MLDFKCCTTNATIFNEWLQAELTGNCVHVPDDPDKTSQIIQSMHITYYIIAAILVILLYFHLRNFYEISQFDDDDEYF